MGGGGAGGRLLVGLCAALMAVGVASAAAGHEAAKARSVVVGFARCTHCSGKKMKPETAFKGLKVAIKCKNDDGKYESKAVGKLDRSGAFRVAMPVDLRGATCFAQLHRASRGPCPGQEPSKIIPLSDDTFVAVAGKMRHSSAKCASAIACYPCRMKHLYRRGTPLPDPYSDSEHPSPEYWPPMSEYPPGFADQLDYGEPIPEYPPAAPGYGHRRPAPEPEYPPAFEEPDYGDPTEDYYPPDIRTRSRRHRRYRRRQAAMRHRWRMPVFVMPEFPPFIMPGMGYGPQYPPAAPYYVAPPPPTGEAPTPEYGAPSPAYQQPAPAPAYVYAPTPAPAYGAPTPAPSDEAPMPAYGAPTPAYLAPAPTPAYGAPTPAYLAPTPMPAYGAATPAIYLAPAPAPAYGAPTPAYLAPTPMPAYRAPTPAYLALTPTPAPAPAPARDYSHPGVSRQSPTN